jgi:phosphoglycerate-specific signal transduction histidine kinase
MNSPRHESLDQALASLPLEIEPARDLWPGIEQATRGATRYRWPVAMAASAALFTLVGTLSWSVWHHTAGEPMAAQPVSVRSGPQRRVSYELPQDSAYQAARGALERTFEERLQLLAPATRERVQQDLAIIRKANADIQEALRADPASPLLLQLMRSTWQQEINLYTTVTHSTDTLLTRRS